MPETIVIQSINKYHLMDVNDETYASNLCQKLAKIDGHILKHTLLP
jgi:hypothetical protein